MFKLSNLNCFEIAISKLCKSSCNSKGNIVIFKDFLMGSKISYEVFDREIFVKMTLLLRRIGSFLPLIHFG
jgi:hypothetical protein